MPNNTTDNCWFLVIVVVVVNVVTVVKALEKNKWTQVPSVESSYAAGAKKQMNQERGLDKNMSKPTSLA